VHVYAVWDTPELIPTLAKPPAPPIEPEKELTAATTIPHVPSMQLSPPMNIIPFSTETGNGDGSGELADSKGTDVEYVRSSQLGFLSFSAHRVSAMFTRRSTITSKFIRSSYLSQEEIEENTGVNNPEDIFGDALRV
jgi:hypothetical protein